MNNIIPRPAEELMTANMLVKHYAGSISYGTNLPTSDVDFRGIFCADPVNVRTPFFPIREATDADEEDTKFYELAHFMKLCLDCNPNIIETLWVDDSDITFRTPAYDILRNNREAMLSSKIAYTTSGYAMSQLKRIKGHNKWINQPQPEEKPKQCNFVSLIQWFGEDKLMPNTFRAMLWKHDYMLVPYGSNTYGMYESAGRKMINKDGSLNTRFDGERQNLPLPEAVVQFNKEEWRLACEKWEQYWNWKTNRNVARSTLEEEHGYDTKHAMHLVRLLRMGVEALRDGVILVKRPDAQELLDIRSGSMTYEDLLAYARTLEAGIEVLKNTTQLPKKPDIKSAANILMAVQDSIWN